MANIILCAKETGNTRKIADAIARLPGWECARVGAISDLDLSAYGVVILGSGVYGGFPHKGLLSFIRNLKPEAAPKQVHVLLTWLGRGWSDRGAFKRLRKECILKGVAVAPEYKKVLGHSFGIIHAKRPNERDIRACVDWVAGLGN